MSERSSQKEQYTHGYGRAATTHFARRTASKEAAFFLPHLRSGMSLLDCGCGLGTITVGLAQAAAPGQAVGIDREQAQIEQARAFAAEQGVSNVRFEVANIYELPFSDNCFDAVFSHMLLEHLNEPRKALKEMYRVLKPGGVIGARSPQISTWVVAPPNPLLERSQVLIGQLMQHNGGNPFIGKHLRALLREAGFEHIQASASCEYYGTPEEIHYWGEALARHLKESSFATKVVELGWADSSEVERMAAAWKEWGQDPDAFYSTTACEAVGWKG